MLGLGAKRGEKTSRGIMDSWSKKKASETCGGMGMAKYIDASETKRLSRLRNVKSSISLSNMTSHSGWQKDQIEKRRRDQVRRRKKEAKIAPLGDGIKVDTQVKREDALTACGLKLKMSTEMTTEKKSQPKPKPFVSRGFPQNKIPSNNRVGFNKNKTEPPPAPDRESPEVARQAKPKQQQQQQQQNNSFRSSGKENTMVSQKKFTKKDTSKHYYSMDIGSLRREHAEAISMLEELNKREEQRRRSLGMS